MSIIESTIDIPMEHVQNICGQFDAYIKKIERTLHTTIILRDGALKIIGPEQTIRQAKSVINNLLELSVRGNKILQNAGFESECHILKDTKHLITPEAIDIAGDFLKRII
jgi:phosphate starvation-inducible protein PhoH